MLTKSDDKIYDNLLEHYQEDFEKTRHGHVWGQISLKVDVSFLPDWVCNFSYSSGQN